uniref:Apple domain-containing protein n=1 Tax=Heterorhabditis bacteriophora TaxID=37862 RepID=A0A1I7XI10_HETBA
MSTMFQLIVGQHSILEETDSKQECIYACRLQLHASCSPESNQPTCMHALAHSVTTFDARGGLASSSTCKLIDSLEQHENKAMCKHTKDCIG